jgi:DNA-binding LytR/AlgR family response regulator
MNSPPPSGPSRALIAEDEPLLAAGLQADLSALWPELQVAAVVRDGTSAVERTLALRPEVCFLDIRMPGASGLEAAQALAEDWPAGAPFPWVVFVTAYDQYALVDSSAHPTRARAAPQEWRSSHPRTSPDPPP